MVGGLFLQIPTCLEEIAPHVGWAKGLGHFSACRVEKIEKKFMLEIIKNDAPEGLGDSKTQN